MDPVQEISKLRPLLPDEIKQIKNIIESQGKIQKTRQNQRETRIMKKNRQTIDRKQQNATKKKKNQEGRKKRRMKAKKEKNNK